MSQNLDSNFTQEKVGSSTGTTGSICTDTSLYKASDGKVQFIEYIPAGTAFPPFPGGKGTKSCTWTRLSLAADGDKASFDSVLVEAGTL
ncbi:MAG TPA: hypothetical protein VKB02_15680 [Pyrinomonadaceae bacterium]|nr:hypothetical protein [Pyrinomonadaceae bacterium]